MKYGDRIIVQAFNGTVQRRVLEVHPTYVLACRESVFQNGWDGTLNAVMGWPISDVVSIEPVGSLRTAAKEGKA